MKVGFTACIPPIVGRWQSLGKVGVQAAADHQRPQREMGHLTIYTTARASLVVADRAALWTERWVVIMAFAALPPSGHRWTIGSRGQLEARAND